MDGSLIVFAGLCMAAASTGAIFTAGPWYDELRKPRWRPPRFLFGPVWLVLYGMIAVSGWRIWTAAPFGEALLPMTLFGVQLVLNALWSPIFFGLRRPDLALAEILVLWLSIAALIATFATIDTLAAWLLVPYLLWVSFAGLLNRAIWVLNRDRLRTGAVG